MHVRTAVLKTLCFPCYKWLLERISFIDVRATVEGEGAPVYPVNALPYLSRNSSFHYGNLKTDGKRDDGRMDGQTDGQSDISDQISIAEPFMRCPYFTSMDYKKLDVKLNSSSPYRVAAAMN